MAVRGVSVDGSAITVTDGSINVTQDPIYETKMSGIGGEVCHPGLVNVSGSFGGLYRNGMKGYFSDMLADEPASYAIIVSDESGGGITAEGCKFNSGEISVRAGEFAKFTLGFIGQNFSITGASGAGTFSDDLGIFTDCSVGSHKASAFTLKIERPYAADDYILSGTGVSESIYQSGDAKVSGTLTFSQSVQLTTLTGSISVDLGDAGGITLNNVVFSGANVNLSNRSLSQKTVNWACGTNQVTFS